MSMRRSRPSTNAEKRTTWEDAMRSKSEGYRLPRRALLRGAAAIGSAAVPAGWINRLFAQSSRTIKLGMVTPRTGPLAPFAEADGFVIDAISKHFANGLEIGGTSFPIEIVV